MSNRIWQLVLVLSLFTALPASSALSANAVSTPAVLVVESPYSFEETLFNLRNAIGEGNFRMIREQSWDYGLKNGPSNSRDTILYFCNFDLVNRAIKLESRIGQLLPFRITISEQDGRVLIMAINPDLLVKAMDNPQLENLPVHVASIYQQIMDNAVF